MSKQRGFAFGILLLTLLVSPLRAQVPPAPSVPQLVNDYAGLMTTGEALDLELKLEYFADTNGAQIAVVTLRDLGSYDEKRMADEIGEKWGVGGKKNDNGVVLLVALLKKGGGRIAISTGYGVEGALPDAICKRLIDDVMVPHFKEDDYAGGINAAVDKMMELLSGEEWEEEEELWAVIVGIVCLVLFVVFIVLVLIAASKGNIDKGDGRNGTGGSARPFIFIGGSGGGFGGGSSSGGFGGFGGGSFGGGGARGGW